MIGPLRHKTFSTEYGTVWEWHYSNNSGQYSSDPIALARRCVAKFKPRNYIQERPTQIYAYYVLYTVGGM